MRVLVDLSFIVILVSFVLAFGYIVVKHNDRIEKEAERLGVETCRPFEDEMWP